VWINSMTGVSGKTISKRHGLLSAALNVAVADKVIGSNPAAGIKIPRVCCTLAPMGGFWDFCTSLGCLGAWCAHAWPLIYSEGAEAGRHAFSWSGKVGLADGRP
jgi:hypothetical protein